MNVDVAVVGAGPAGLATAYALDRAGLTVRVLESDEAVGGRMRTLRARGCLIDTGAEMLPSAAGYPATWRLIRAVGLDADAVPRVCDALGVWRDGRVHPHVGRPLGLLTGAGLPPRARLDLVRLRLRLARRRPGPATTVADLVGKYHPDLREFLVEPLVAGFFGWDPRRSAAAVFAEHLTTAGSTNTWHTYRDGMDSLARALAVGLDVVTGHEVTGVVTCPGGVRLESPRGSVTARAAVLAVPAPVAARLHPGAPPDERAYLEACTYAPMLRLSLVLNRPAAAGWRGFATLVPATEDPVLNVITADHRKHPGRAPAGRGLISLITSPYGTATLMGERDEKVADQLVGRAERFVPGLASRVARFHVHRFPYGLPEATPRALALRAAFEGRPGSAVEYAGDWVALRPCSEGAVAAAERTAARVLARLT
ncbi:amine oxidase [Nonomuraea sp. WAC 01424]|uniref:protoporphyrinogen/coproporphyrinogen oxidase n=1 Tax=Nonomuraea sp. WAC 01424 TaxID=2203200 RepID=UPI000F7B03BE|nr:FAD-dependent oxidoreductase [Nonomuraea sp. WAC 01424]RSN08419.1 amine oxidase [Nonomuraea sp. WAC 01424]